MSKSYDDFAGYQSFHNEDGEEYGSLEIFWHEKYLRPAYLHPKQAPGWYWWSCFPGYLPDGDPAGPFETSREALEDADEYNPEFVDYWYVGKINEDEVTICKSLAEATAKLLEIEKDDPQGFFNGEYYLDGPERLS